MSRFKINKGDGGWLTFNIGILALHIVEYPLGIACHTHIYSLDNLHIRTEHVCPLEFWLFDTIYNEFLGPDIHISTTHTQPYKIILCLFYAIRAYIDIGAWGNLNI